jgi:hypothetical protein
MIHIIEVIPVTECCFKTLVIAVTAVLVISLLINFFLASDSHVFSSPPLRMKGFIAESGDPAPGYYYAPGQQSLFPSGPPPAEGCK